MTDLDIDFFFKLFYFFNNRNFFSLKLTSAMHDVYISFVLGKVQNRVHKL